MTYAMTLDNSWEIMDENEMYDVNGGKYLGTYTNLYGVCKHFGKWLGFSGYTVFSFLKNGISFGSIMAIFSTLGLSFAAWKVGMFVGTLANAEILVLEDGNYSMHSAKVAFVTVAMWATD